MSTQALQVPGRYYRSGPLDARGYVDIEVELPRDRTALILCDVVGTGFDDDAVRPQTPPLISSWDVWELQRTMVREKIAPLAAAFRAAGLPVVYIENRYPDLSWQTGPFSGWWEKSTGFVHDPEAPPALVEYSQIVAPTPSDFIVPKPHDNGFHEAPLDLLLRNLGVRDVVICGFAAECCLLSTIQGAYERGYRTLLVRDACLADEHHDSEEGLKLTAWSIRVIESSRGPSALTEDVITALDGTQRVGYAT